MLVESRAARPLLVNLWINSVQFFKNSALFEWMVHVTSGELCKVLRSILDHSAGSCGRKALAAVKPIEFVVIVVGKSFFPFAFLGFDILLDEDPKGVWVPDKLVASCFVN